MKVKLYTIFIIGIMIILFYDRSVFAELNNNNNQEEPSILFSFQVEVSNAVHRSGEEFILVVKAMDRDEKPLLTYAGEELYITGGSPAPDGTAPIYNQLEEWKNGERRYAVSLFAAEGSLQITVQDGDVIGTSSDIRVKAGKEDKIEISAGNNQTGEVGRDITKFEHQTIEVIVYDTWGNPVDSANVMFKNATNGSSFDTDKSFPGVQETKLTSGGGKADCDVWVLGKKAGINTIEAAINFGSFSSVTFTAYGKVSRFIENTGMIFNTNDLLSQDGGNSGGIGLKYYINEKFAYKLLFDFYYSNNLHTTSLDLNNSFEYHFFNNRISPYIGGTLGLGYVKVRTEEDADNWSETLNIPVSLESILGVECFVFNFLSLFAEFQFSIQFFNYNNKQSIAGVITKERSSDFTIDAGLGNNSKLGLILYFGRDIR